MKLPESDFSEIEDKDAGKHPAYPVFHAAMKGHCYGHEALNDAWWWFRDGWDESARATPSASPVSTGGDAPPAIGTHLGLVRAILTDGANGWRTERSDFARGLAALDAHLGSTSVPPAPVSAPKGNACPTCHGCLLPCSGCAAGLSCGYLCPGGHAPAPVSDEALVERVAQALFGQAYPGLASNSVMRLARGQRDGWLLQARAAIAAMPAPASGAGTWTAEEVAKAKATADGFRDMLSDAVPSAPASGARTLTRDQLLTLYAEHCECRPLRTDRAIYGHSHDCDTGITDDIEAALRLMDESSAPASAPGGTAGPVEGTAHCRDCKGTGRRPCGGFCPAGTTHPCFGCKGTGGAAPPAATPATPEET